MVKCFKITLALNKILTQVYNYKFIKMKKLLILLFVCISFFAKSEICQVTLQGDWSNSTLHIYEPNNGVDTIINQTSLVWFRGTSNAIFSYQGINSVNTFEYLNCAGQSFTSFLLTNGDVHISLNVLPVDLTFFDGRLLDNSIILNWKTETEENNKGFEIEKSKNGKEWEKIAFIEGNGTTIINQNYSYIDYLIYNDLNYYRLKQIDYSEKFEYSKVICIKNNIKTENKIFGNVVKDNLVIRGKGLIYIANSFGVIINNYYIEDDIITIDISNLSKGIYYVITQDKVLSFVKI